MVGAVALVAESEAHGLALNSRMAHLRCDSAAERLLIPAFIFLVRYFRLNPLWALTLPLAGVLYGAMAADSATAPAGIAAPLPPS